jgi:hypothetical protein
MLRPDMKGWRRRVPWDEVGNGAKTGVKRGEMVGEIVLM